MAQFFGGKGGAVSITDSTMMRIVHDAMNRAHERVKSKEGVIERLNEISKFYELAVMQLEGCTRFVQEESSHEEEVLEGLSEIRNRLIGRLHDSESAMGDKDRELAARTESEASLRRALAGKERELASLKAKLERTRTTMADQQLLNMRQRLEPDCNDDERRGEGTVGDEKVEEMGSDIDALKETLDVAFGRMRNTVFLSEVAPLEQQWRWGVEKDALCILIRGIATDFREILERRSPRRFDEFWLGLMDEVTGLKSDLDSLFAEAPGRSADSVTKETEEDEGGKHYVAKLIKNHESIIRKKSSEAEERRREKLLSASCRREKEPDCLKKRVQRVIAKLDRLVEWNEKLFESCEETNGEEIVFETLEDAWKSTAKVSSAAENIRKLEKELEDIDLENKMRDQIYVTLFRGLSEELSCELLHRGQDEMKNQWDQSNNIESQIRDEIFCIVFGDVIKAFGGVDEPALTESRNGSDEDNLSSILEDVEIQGTMRDQIETLMFGRAFKDWNDRIDACDCDVDVRQDICFIIFEETIKTTVHDATSALRRCHVKLTEESLKNDVCAVFITETLKEWMVEADEYTKQTLVGQDAVASCQDLESMYCDDKLRKCKQVETPELNRVGLKCEVFGAKRRSSSVSIKPQKTTITFSKENLLDQSGSLLGFFQVMADFEHAATHKLGTNNLRLEEAKQQLKAIAERGSSLREKKSLYVKAFIIRCQNLHKAETEVDLLGDQVEGLLALLHKVHATLQNRSPNHWVLEILQLIEKEWNGMEQFIH